MSTINLATYSAPIELDDSGLQKGLNKMDSDVKDKAGGISKFLKTSLLGALTAVGAASASLFAMTTKSAEATDRIDKMSQRLGMSRQAFQEWDFILSQNGVSIDQMQGGMKNLSQRMNDVIEGTGKGTELFKKLGVSVKDSSGAVKKQEDVFYETVKALQGMEDGIEKAALAQELFGRNGQELLPMLNASKGSIDEMTEKARELGLVLGDEAIDSGVLFTDTMDQVKRMLGSVATQIGVGLMPVIQSFLEWVMQYMPEIQATFSFVFGIMETLVTGFVDIIGFLITWLHNWYKENQDTVNNIKDSFMEFFSIVTDFFKAFIDIVSELWDRYGEDILNIAKKYLKYLQDQFETVFEIIKGIFKFFTALFKGDWEGMGKALVDITKNFFKFIKDTFDTSIELLKDILKLAGEAFLGLGADMMNFLWDGMKSVWTSIKTWVEETVAWLVSKLAFWKSAQATMSGGGGNTSSTGGSPSSLIPQLAVGTPFVQSDGLAYIHKGESVLPASVNPWNPENSNKQNNPVHGNTENHYHISKLEFPNVHDGQDVVDTLKHLSTYVTQKIKK